MANRNLARRISIQLLYAVTGCFDIPAAVYLLVKSNSWWLLKIET